MKTINYYIKNVYGQDLEYVSDSRDAQIIQQLTGKRTINSNTRALIEQLAEMESKPCKDGTIFVNGQIKFKLTLPPQNT
jgi:hypothetical protein